MLYYLGSLFFLTTMILYLGRSYWEKRDPTTMIQLISLILGVGLAVTHFFINSMQADYGGDYGDSVRAMLVFITLPRGLLIGFLMGLITNTSGPSHLLLRIVRLVIIGPVLFIVLGGFLFWPHPIATSAVLGALMGFILELMQALLLAYAKTKGGEVDDIKFSYKGSD